MLGELAGRNSAASVSLRYERRIGYDDNSADGDTISGVARAGIMVAKGVTLEAGALAAQTRVEGNGASSLGGFAGDDDATSQIYSAYAGPSVHTMAGDVELEGHYRFGYTRVEEPDAVVVAPGAQPVDFFDDNGLSSFRGYPYWLRSVAGHPTQKYADHPFTFWQYTGTGVVPGIRGNADINVFNGNMAAWKKWLKQNAT